MGNHIVIEPASKIREIARNALAGFWKPVVISILIYYMLTTGVQTLLDNLFAFTNPVDVYGQEIVSTLPYGGSIYSLIIGGPLELGFSIFLLTFFRKRSIDNTLLFEGFSRFGKAFLLYILMSVKIMLWGLLFVIPGFIAAIRYSQAFFVLADNPDMSANQCIKESCRIMAGNKGRYFYLQLTFIGWMILSQIPNGIFSSLSDSTGAMAVIMGIICGLPTIVVNAYMMIANTAFYELATENLVVMNGTDYDNMVNADYTVKEEPEVAPTSEESAPTAEESTPATEPAAAPDENVEKPAEKADVPAEEPVTEEPSEERPE